MFEPEEEAGEVREENSSESVTQPAGEPEVPTTEENDPPAQGAYSPAPENEYHFNREEYREQVYADAHYEPAGESTVPPRYYCPGYRRFGLGFADHPSNLYGGERVGAQDTETQRLSSMSETELRAFMEAKYGKSAFSRRETAVGIDTGFRAV